MRSLTLLFVLLAIATSHAQPYPDTLWTRLYEVSYDYQHVCIRPTHDGGFVISACLDPQSYLGVSGLTKVDGAGFVTWHRLYFWEDSLATTSVTESDSHNVYVAGLHSDASGWPHAFVIKLDEEGNEVWSQSYESTTWGYKVGIAPWSSNGFALVLQSDLDVWGRGKVLFCDSNGEIVLSHSFEGSDFRNPTVIRRTNDGGVIVAGSTRDSESNIWHAASARFDEQGQLMWLHADEYPVDSYVIDAAVTPDGNNVFLNTRGGFDDGLLVRTTDNGDTLWWQTFVIGGVNSSLANCLVLPNGQIVVTGSTGTGIWSQNRFWAHWFEGSGLPLTSETYERYWSQTCLSAATFTGNRCILAGPIWENSIGHAIMVACIDETGFHFLEPQPDEVLGIDSLFVFRWIPLSPGAVTLDVDRNYPSGEWELIAEHLSEDGEHPWIVTPPESDHARFRIRSEDNPQIADTTDGDIWIAHPRLALTYPDGGDTIWASNSDTIRFRRLLKYCSVSAQLNRDYPNGEWENVNAAGYGTDYLVWHVRGPSSFNCRMRIFDPSDTTVMDSSQEDFALLESHLRVLSPNGGEHVLGSSWQMIRWSFPHYTGNVEIMINFYYPANPWSYIVESMPNSGDYWWWVPPVPGGHCRIRVRALGNPEMMDTSDDNFSIVLATETVETPLLPTEFSLSAFPNPFNAISTLTLALPEATQLSLTLYDVNGRVVQSLASGVFTAGIHAVPVDGSPLPSGLYFVQLSSVRYSATHKLLLLK